MPQVMATIFTTIQLMIFFLHTVHGDLATFLYGGGLSASAIILRMLSANFYHIIYQSKIMEFVKDLLAC